MLKAGYVSLTHPSQWQDPYESVFLGSGGLIQHRMVLGIDRKYHSGLPRTADSVTANIGMINAFGHLVSAQCFGEQPESERTWNAYHSEGRLRWCVDSDHYIEAIRLAVGNRFIALKFYRLFIILVPFVFPEFRNF